MWRPKVCAMSRRFFFTNEDNIHTKLKERDVKNKEGCITPQGQYFSKFHLQTRKEICLVSFCTKISLTIFFLFFLKVNLRKKKQRKRKNSNFLYAN